MKNREPIWWIPPARRTIGWGLIMMGVWGFVVSMSLLLPLSAMSSWSQTPLGRDWIGELALRAMNIAPFLPYVCGFILGATSSFYAPRTEPKNPLKSLFARNIAIDTLLFCLLFNLIFVITVTVILQFVNLKSVVRAFPFIEAAFVSLFGLGLSWAIVRSRREVTVLLHEPRA